MAKNDQKKLSNITDTPGKPIIRIPFPRENKHVYDDIVSMAGKKGLSLAGFGRMAMIHYMDQIKNKSIIL